MKPSGNIRHHKMSFSCERVGRILAGSGVITGVVLGYLHHPFWFYIIGLGTASNLIVSGITDKCAVKNLLLRLGFPSERELGVEASHPQNEYLFVPEMKHAEHT